MSRALIAAEMQHLLEQLQQQIEACERLATSSGLVQASHFRAMRTMCQMAAGDLDQKGLLVRQPATEKVPE